jgi:drug/metabolite transporter (DMT)-like permease
MAGADKSDPGFWQRLGARAWASAPLLLVLSALFWALNPLVGRAVRDLISPVTLAFWRWTLAFAVTTAIAWPHLRRDWPRIVANWKILVLLGLLGIGIFSTLVYWALRYTTAVNNLLMQSAMPSIIIVSSALFFRDRITLAQIAGAALSLAGLLVIITHGSIEVLRGLGFNKGDAASLLAVFLYALYSAMLRKRPAIHPMSLLSVLFLVGVFTLLPVYLVELWQGVRMDARPETLAAIVYVGLFPSLFSFLFFNRGVDLIGPIRAGQYMNLPPVFGTILAILLLGEHLALFHIAGAALVAAGIWASSLDARAARRRAAAARG